jgi:hypothetical protein
MLAILDEACMKQFRLFLCLLALAIACGCGGGGGTNPMSGSSAQLRVLQTSPDMSGFDVQLDDHAFFTTGGGFAYKPVASGAHALEITAAATSILTSIPDSFSIPATFAANSSQTVIVAGATEDRTLAAFLVVEDTKAPRSGQIKLRFVHGAHDVGGPIDIYLADASSSFPPTPTFANVAYLSATSTLTRPARNFSLCWTPAGATNPLSGGPPCGVVETIVVGGKFPLNSTFVLADPLIDPSAPPGTFSFIHFDVLGN